MLIIKTNPALYFKWNKVTKIAEKYAKIYGFAFLRFNIFYKYFLQHESFLYRKLQCLCYIITAILFFFPIFFFILCFIIIILWSKIMFLSVIAMMLQETMNYTESNNSCSLVICDAFSSNGILELNISNHGTRINSDTLIP